MMDTLNVYILESPSHDDLAAERSGNQLTGRLIELMGWPVTSRRVANGSHLKKACAEFAAGIGRGEDSYDTLIITAHGCAEGIGLTDGTLVDWNELFSLLGESICNATVILSSCSVLKNDLLRTYLDQQENQPLDLIGFREDVDWSGAMVAVSMLLKTTQLNLHNKNESPTVKIVRQLNTFSSIWNLYDLDIQALRFTGEGSASVRGSHVEFAHHETPGKPAPMPNSMFGPVHIEAILELKSIGVEWAIFDKLLGERVNAISAKHEHGTMSSDQIQELEDAFWITHNELMNSVT